MADVAQTFALNPYAAEQAKNERLQRYAELLQSQGLAPNEKFSYNGIEAPPSAAGALAKGLQLGVSGYLQGRGMRKADELSAKAQTESKEFIDTLTGKPGEVAPTRGLGISDFEDRQVVGGKYDPEAGPQKLATALSGNIPVAPGQGDVVPGSAPLSGAERTAALLRGAVSGNPMIAPLASSLYAKDIEPPKLEKIGADDTGLIFNPTTRKYEPISAGQLNDKKPFSGNAEFAQLGNMLLKGDPSSPEYLAAYNLAKRPRVTTDASGQSVTETPDMSGYRLPIARGTGMGPAGGVQAGSVPGALPGTPADRSKLKAMEAGAEPLLDTLAEFAETVKMAKPEDWASAFAGGTTEGGRKLTSGWTNASLMAKGEELYNLGVLAKEDLVVLQNSLPNPSTLTGAATSKEAYITAITAMENLINRRLRAARRQYGDPNSPATPPRSSGGKKPANIAQADWDRLTPEDRLLWR